MAVELAIHIYNVEFSQADDYLSHVNMGLFGPSLPKRVTKEEFDRIKNRLYGELDSTERAQVEMLFRADLHESGSQSGITQEEFDAGIAWLEDNMSKHVLESSDIEKVKEYFAEHLQD